MLPTPQPRLPHPPAEALTSTLSGSSQPSPPAMSSSANRTSPCGARSRELPQVPVANGRHGCLPSSSSPCGRQELVSRDRIRQAPPLARPRSLAAVVPSPPSSLLRPLEPATAYFARSSSANEFLVAGNCLPDPRTARIRRARWSLAPASRFCLAPRRQQQAPPRRPLLPLHRAVPVLGRAWSPDAC
nr:uncharacterized protein LOC120963883 [Aegilops tauschii subsp. strangulata]